MSELPIPLRVRVALRVRVPSHTAMALGPQASAASLISFPAALPLTHPPGTFASFLFLSCATRVHPTPAHTSC